MSSIKNKIKNVFFPVIFYIIIIQIPTALLLFVFNILQFPSHCNYIFNSVFCFFVASIFTIIFFMLVSLLPRVLLNIVVLLIYTLSGAFLYFLINYRKLYDADVLKNFFTVGVELVGEFMSFQLFLFIVASFICGIISLKIKSAKLLRIAKIISFAFICIFFVLLIAGIGKFKFSQSLVIINAYMPFAAITETIKYFNSYNNFLKIKERKKDISKLYKYKFTNKGNDPLVVVMVIGESLRGDINGLNNEDYNNMPYLNKIQNLISYRKATSSSTSTTKSIPYMLTRAVPPNWDLAIGESSAISIFKSLGFKTIWLSSQTIGGMFELDYTPIILESDITLTRNDIRKRIGDTLVKDGDLIPILKNILKEKEGENLLIILQMIGSHWDFDKRYPSDFEKYKPTCKAGKPASCSDEEIFNGYFNTVLYSDYFLSEIIKLLDDKNSFLLFASDHGYSLREDGLFGNSDPKVPPTPYQTNIAMFLWGSDKYKKYYGDVFLNFDKVSKKVSHNNIFHSLLDCANVESNVVDRSLSLCQRQK